MNHAVRFQLEMLFHLHNCVLIFFLIRLFSIRIPALKAHGLCHAKQLRDALSLAARLSNNEISGRPRLFLHNIKLRLRHF